MNQTYQFGIEEDYSLADAKTRGIPRRTVKAFREAVRTRLPRAERDLLQSHIEVSTPPSTSFAEPHETLARLRPGLAEIRQSHGILVLSAGTRPVVRWTRHTNTPKGRCEKLLDELHMLGCRNVVCGMHVHVEVPRPERVDLMNRPLPYMPLLGLRGIVTEGTSADRQLATFTDARTRGFAERDVIGAVVDWLAGTTAGRNPS